MFDWLTDLRKSAEEKRDETITAYIDEALPPGEKSRFEAELNREPELRSQVEAERQLKLMLSQLPPLRAPRNFGLDPAVYGREKPAIPLFESLYPQLRTATAVAAFCLLALFAYSGLTTGNPASSNIALQESAPIAQVETTATAPPPPTDSVEVEAEQALLEEAEMAADEEMADSADMAEVEPVSPRTITSDEVRVFEDDQDAAMADESSAQSSGEADIDRETFENEPNLNAEVLTQPADTARSVTEVAVVEEVEGMEEAAGDTVITSGEQTTFSNDGAQAAARTWSGLQITLILLALLTTALLILTIWSRRQISRYQ